MLRLPFWYCLLVTPIASTAADKERRAPHTALKEHLRLLSQLNPVPCRDDLAQMAQTHLNLTGRAAEVGVNRGLFAQKNLRIWTGEYWAIDAWSLGSNSIDQSNYRHPKTKIENVDHVMYNQAAERIAPFGTRAHMMRAFSVDAAASFPDSHFDWLYIDALHTYEAVLSDLRAWWPKLRVNGLFSGDDFANQVDDAEYAPVQRFLRKYGWNAADVTAHTRWGTVRAVQEFAAEVGAVVRVSYLDDCYLFPAWYIIKPPPYL